MSIQPRPAGRRAPGERRSRAWFRRSGLLAAGAFLSLLASVARAEPRCSGDGNLLTWPSANGLKFSACIHSPGLGFQSVSWGAQNETNDKLEVTFVKVYDLTCGNTFRREASILMEPGEFVYGGNFVGDLSMNDAFFKEDCNREVKVASLSIERLRIENLSEQARRREQEEEERAQKERQEQEQRRLEEERQRLEREQAERKEQAERERVENEARGGARLQEERAARQQQDWHREQQAREEAERHEAERQQAIRETWDRQKEVADQQRATQQEQIQQIGALIATGGGGSAPTGPSWRLRFDAGGGWLILPIVTNSEGADIESYSNNGSAAGLGLYLAGEFWPLFGRSFGVGALASMSYGYMPAEGGGSTVLELETGMRLAIGPDETFAGLVQLSWASRNGTDSSNTGMGYIDAYTSGSGEYGAVRIGVGAHLCFTKDENGFCDTALEAWGFYDRPSFLGAAASTPLSWRIELASRRSFAVGVDFSTSYPVAGTPIHPIDSDMELEDLRVTAYASTNFDFFGSPYW